MINKNRIVPVTKTDLITLYGNILKIAGVTIGKTSTDEPGVFALTEGSGNILADEPVKSFDFGSDVSAAVIYFVPDFGYEGFSIAGTKVVTLGADVDADGATLYTATLSSGDVTIAKVGF